MNNWYLLAAIPVFGLLVLVHEFGHFITAKWAGIRVEEFGLGIPPRLLGFRKRDQGGWEIIWFGGNRDEETNVTQQTPFNGTSGGVSNLATPSSHTIYSLNFLPIGGFVRMPGENGDIEDVNGNYDPQSFAAKSASKRIIVLVAGVVMNFLLAMVLFTIIYAQGDPTSDPRSVIGQVVPGSPAAAAGLHDHDMIVAVNGQPVKLFSDMANLVNKVISDDKGQHATVAIHLLVERHGVSQPIPITVNALVNPPSGQGHMGVVANIIFVSAPIWQAPFKGIAHTFDITHEFIDQIGQMIIGAVRPQLSGPVGIVRITGQEAQSSVDLGWWPILNLTAILSLNLAIINILPFPALDGGRILLILIELVRGGKRLKPEREG
ncbi:MAG: site-2 protease family protein, partial [Chloroflexi bacterium]|nr:site-2 protease family protein [Chloroflexota bacterium]